MNENDWLLPGAVKDQQSIDCTWRPVPMTLIDGVVRHEVLPVATGYGRLVELHRAEWDATGAGVGQVFASILQRGRLSAWHAHASTVDRIAVVAGAVRLVLFDARPGSSTHGLVNEFRLTEHRPGTVVIPPRVWHGVQNIGETDSIIVNSVDRAYDYEAPDHYRLAPDSDRIPFRFPAA